MKSNNNISKKQPKSLHYVYVTFNRLNNQFYFGKRSTNNKNDGYMGSGVEITKQIKMLGKKSFINVKFARFNTEQEAFDAEEMIIRKFINNPLCLNKIINARASKCNQACYITSDGKILYLSVNDEKVLSGEVHGHTKGMVPCVLPDGTKKSLHKTDPLYIKGIAVHVTTGISPPNKGKKWNKKYDHPNKKIWNDHEKQSVLKIFNENNENISGYKISNILKNNYNIFIDRGTIDKFLKNHFTNTHH